ncbi:PIG-L family deacetylase [Candidatus Dojkabacteria bacterium]|uniref:PIG-L family deacetylase n=1 Tax=Candidatus Dojkabacteria bacterium TaxID=2099670 RepID=A0A955LA73_9BACT|nr:PIG-L family deacetylase [Candidatus Dojkabacteria bacterium]
MILLLLLLSLISGLIATYIFILLRYHDTSLPSLDLTSSKNILFIFPHPDDETMATGGLINSLSKIKNIHVISTTHGENGIELLNLPSNELGNIRKKEFECVMKKLNVKKLEIWEFEDGDCEKAFIEIKNKVKEYINKNSIDTIFTFERTGLYPHPDHIILSKIIHEITKEKKDLQVVYSTLTKKLREKANLPTKLTYRDREVVLKDLDPSLPQYKVFIFKSLYAKYRAAKCYKSQKLNGNMPLWLELFLMPVEYYTTKY